jgi:hypothetical protein
LRSSSPSPKRRPCQVEGGKLMWSCWPSANRTIQIIYMYDHICIRILYVYGSPHLCLFPYHLLRPQVWFEGARLVEKKGTAAAIFLGSWNPHFSCVSHENGWPSGG